MKYCPVCNKILKYKKSVGSTRYPKYVVYCCPKCKSELEYNFELDFETFYENTEWTEN